MPTYQYSCTECGTPLEVVQRFTDAPLTECPTCGGRLRKVFSAVGVVFKGSGFYRTDSRESTKSTVNGSAPKKDAASSKNNASSDSAGTPAAASASSASKSAGSDGTS